MIKDIQANSKRMRLFQILNQQLERLINEGRSDFHSLFTSLKAEALVSEKEYRELRTIFTLEAVSFLYAVKRSRTDLDISGIGGDVKGLLKYRY